VNQAAVEAFLCRLIPHIFELVPESRTLVGQGHELDDVRPLELKHMQERLVLKTLVEAFVDPQDSVMRNVITQLVDVDSQNWSRNFHCAAKHGQRSEAGYWDLVNQLAEAELDVKLVLERLLTMLDVARGRAMSIIAQLVSSGVRT
jgi:hypothetical protein